MIQNDYESAGRIISDLDVRRAACKILGVSEGEDEEAFKKAYRQASLKYHPDHNPDDKDAYKRFLPVKCANEFLAKNEPCVMLLEEIEPWPGPSEDGQFDLENLWAYF
jgi:DnaJ-class molecular chaperone